ncbi:AraC family transcriptional regulator [Neolewinella xylanilytica]|uniref:AraC family transcriptional regulator n=1 Tax=Neolewinella xylanilytica TaxID=1514080 RepID=A0A2S6I129_9BACT|nr:helix-turn-helix transcriptional regulator [Neolewinella xylanilytica]PPK84583.1 AraC family transcriptional regulator [Neolewinella xylanilytica]
MKKPTDNIRVIDTLADYARLCGHPAPAHPLVTLLDLKKTRERMAGEPPRPFEPIVQNLYSIAVKRGLKGTIYYGRRTHDFSSGVLTFMAPGQMFSVDKNLDISEMAGWSLLFHPDLLYSYPLGRKIAEYGFFHYDTTEALHLSAEEEAILDDVLRGIEREYLRPIDSFSQDVIVSQLEVLLTYADRFYHRQFVTRAKVPHDLLSRFESQLRAHMVGEDGHPVPTVGVLAGELGVTPAYLSDMLRSLTGLTTQQHIHQAVIEKAKGMLLSSSRTVAETAYALGFEYPQYFSRLFRQKTGISPTEFRRQSN